MTPLLSLEHFEPVCEALRGKRLTFAYGSGWAGDDLIVAGTYQLFRHVKAVARMEWFNADYFVWGGGGNLGSMHPDNCARRRKYFNDAPGLPWIILPQSMTPGEPEALPPGALVFARERTTQSRIPGSILAPDLALFLPAVDCPPPDLGVGVFFRGDAEQCNHPELGDVKSVDAKDLCRTAGELLTLTARHDGIMTDRLHVAIAGLLCGRKVSLFPNSYYKNEAVHREWLAGLGCRWCEDLR